MLNVDGWDLPIVLAPMAGGPSTPELAAAVSGAGGLGFLAAGYLTPGHLADQLDRLTARTGHPVGVNVFCPSKVPGSPEAIAEYAAALASLTRRPASPRRGEVRRRPLRRQARIDRARRPAVVSFTFGCPDPGTSSGCTPQASRCG